VIDHEGRSKEFEQEIIQLLEASGFQVQTNVTVGGVQPDIVVAVPDGRIYVVEVKAWEKKPGFTVRAARQAQLFEQEIGVDGAYVVVKDLERSRPQTGVVMAKDLVSALRKDVSEAKGEAKRQPPSLKSPGKIIFAAMPFSGDYEDVFFVAMAPAAEAVGAVCKRVDREEYAGNVVEKVRSTIRESIAVIADLSESRPNVLYEAGFAHALDKPTVHICSTPLKDLPFDVAQWNTIEYQKGQTHKLQSILTNRLRSILA